MNAKDQKNDALLNAIAHVAIDYARSSVESLAREFYYHKGSNDAAIPAPFYEQVLYNYETGDGYIGEGKFKFKANPARRVAIAAKATEYFRHYLSQREDGQILLEFYTERKQARNIAKADEARKAAVQRRRTGEDRVFVSGIQIHPIHLQPVIDGKREPYIDQFGGVDHIAIRYGDTKGWMPLDIFDLLPTA